MPELPEVENIKFGLEEVVINKKIVNITYSKVVEDSHKVGKWLLLNKNLALFQIV